jgi:hypothetical protein
MKLNPYSVFFEKKCTLLRWPNRTLQLEDVPKNSEKGNSLLGKVLAVSFLFCLGIFGASAQTTFTCTLSANANWSTATWVKTGTATTSTYPGQFPGENHIVVINGTNPQARTLTLDMNIVQSVSSISINNNGRIPTLSLGANTLNMSGDLTGDGTITFTTGTLNIGGNNTHTGTFTRGTGTVNYNGADQTVRGTTYYNLIISGSGTKSLAANTILGNTLTIASGSAFNAGTTTISWSGAGGTANINGIFKTANANGFSGTAGTAISSGNAPTISLGVNSTIDYNAVGAQNVTPITYNNLTISGSGTKTLTAAATVTGIFTLNGGILATTATNLLSVTNSATNAISGGSPTSFINGPVKRTLPPNMIAGSTYNFPVGKGTTYLPFALVNPTTGSGTVTSQVEAFASNPGGFIDATLSSKSNSEYWSLASTGNFTNSSISISRPAAVTPLDVIGGSVTSNGTYTSLNGTAGTYDISVSDPIGSNRFFALAGKKQTITTGTISGSPFCSGSAVSVPFTISGTFVSGNVFTAQLSDASGSFGTPTNIGTLGSTTAGTINATIPSSTATGSGYRIRVISDTPAITGSDNGVGLVVNQTPAVLTSVSASPSAINFGDPGLITLSAVGGGGLGATLKWYVGGCGSGTSIGSGTPLSISPPSGNTTYYARWEGANCNSTCLSTTVTVVHTYYSYQSGDWNLASTWTTDQSGSFSVNPGIPTSTDRVVILNGRTITVNQNSKIVNSLEIKLGGTLDLQTYDSHNFGTVSGEGVLKLASNNFPGGTYTNFTASTGGIVEYYNLNNQGISNTQLTYNKLVISNYTGSSNTVFLDNASNGINYTVNGSFDLKNYGAGNLTFCFGNPTPSDNLINMTVNGSFNVAAGCFVRVNNFATSHTLASSDVSNSVANPIHSLSIYGDFANNGSVRFTGLPSPFNNAYYLNGVTAYAGTNYGDVQVTFAGATSNTVTCNGVTDFFRLIVDKGSDPTHTLEIFSSNTSNFALYGPNNQGNGTFAGYGYYYKALFPHNGTLKLNSNINIPSLTEGGQDFNLLPSACLWVNGANVSTTVTGLNGTGYQAATFYGKLRISSGQFSTGDAAGIVLGDLGIPEIYIEGTGTLDVSQVWNNTGATNLISYTQTGGTANFRLMGENHASAMFSLNNPNAVFNMSGGVINFINNTFADATNNFQVFNINVVPGNYTVTGGSINLNLPSSATIYTANANVPFYNMNLTNKTGTGTTTVRILAPGTNLTLLHDLMIGAGATLDLGTNTIDLLVGHDFNLATGATYTPGANTTTFNGAGGQIFTNLGTITTGLNNLTLSNSSNTNISNNLTVNGLLLINNGCTLNDQGFTINATGNISNSGTHTSQANGSIIMNGTGAQTMNGSGNGVFGNLTVNKTSGTATLSANQSINGNLRLASGILNIGTYNLNFSATSAIYDVLSGTPAPTTFGTSKMIATSGAQSDGGITKAFNTTGSFLYPFGTGTSYHPATISFSQAPTSWGSVTIRPVAAKHPSVVTGSEALNYYWKTTSSSFAGIQPGSVTHTYQYVPSDAGAAENTYVTGVYNPFAWTSGSTLQVDIINKKIYFPSVQILNGEYTAGIPSAFGAVKVYYSHKDGNWDTPGTWSNVSNSSATDALTAPGANDLVVIGDGGTNNHVVTISANTRISGGMELNAGSTLELGTTTGHNFTTITGTGKLRISSTVSPAVFPGGDFADFLGSSGGTVEYYNESGIGSAFTLPTTYLKGAGTINITSYCNLILSPSTGKIITLPNTDLLVHKDLNVNISGGSPSGIAQLNNQANSRTLGISGNLNINNGNLQYPNNSVQNVTVNGNVTVAAGSLFNVASANAATNTLSIQGNLTNNGIFDMTAGATQICNVIFTGSTNTKIQGTTATQTDFNTLTVNKGVDRTSILEVTVNAMTLNTALASAMTLTNGTFRLSANLPLTLSTTSAFTVPSTACLSATNGTINLCTANNNAADLLLHGRLELTNSGIVNVGNGTGANNDIEYSSSGYPEISISGGNLNVDGQIRRNTANTLGSLVFNQSGGTITVKGKSLDNTRGIFEVLNSGSQFNITGGNLIIENAGSVTFADVNLAPGSSTVNNTNGGHTITFGNSSTPAGQTFKLNTTSQVWNLTIDGTTNSKTASLSVNPLTVLNNLTINGASSVFKANDLDVTIGGSLVNNNTSIATGANSGGYQAGVSGSTQNTTFTGVANITGVGTNLTNFANLVIGTLSTTPSITLSSNSSIRVNNNLTITSGTISDAGNTITVMGNVSNSGIHASPASPGGGILLSNSAKQVITSVVSSKLGNITVNNPAGVDVIGDSWITGQLKLTAGLLYINDYKLVMDVNSSFGGTYDVNRMVQMNGAVSDKGVQKYFAGSASGFLFPIGSTGKYRPVTFSFTSANAGSITITPVNQAHPSDFAPTSDQLNYYWKTTVTGFSGVSAVSQVYQYDIAEVTGNEGNYYGARFSNFAWSNYGKAAINSTAHTITVTDLLTGDYTAGEVANFGIIHKLYSKSNGNWTDLIWAEDAPGNPTCGYYPNGNPVFIQPGHTITMNINSASASSVDILGTFDLKQTEFHNLGAITDTTHAGTGKIRIEATASGMFLFPGGNYDRFMASTGTTVELYGTTDAQMPLKPGNIAKPYQNLILTGTGIKYMSAETLKILGNLTINAGAKLSDILFNKELYILGNWTDHNTSPATGGFVPGLGLVSFEGSSTQLLTVTNPGITENFYDFQMKNPAGLTIAGFGNAQIYNTLNLVNGAITTTATNSLTLTNASTSAVSGGSATSYINGPLRKQISNSSFFTFPVGKTGSPVRYGQIYLSGIVTAGIWEAEYYNSTPPYNINSKLSPIVSVSNNEYWRVKGVASGSANVTLRWDSNSGVPAPRSNTRVTEWNSTQWENRGNIVVDNGASDGTVKTDNAIGLASDHYLTIGSGSLPLPTAVITSPLTASVCNDGIASTTVTVALTGTAPWSLTYQLGAVTTTLNNIASSPVSIVLTSNSPGITQPISTSTNFDFKITNINDLNGVAGTSDYVTKVVLTVNPIPDNTITGKTLVGTGEIVSYTTPVVAGTTYAWTLSSNGTPLTGTGSTFTVTWGAGTPGPYTIGLTKTSSAGCQVTNSLSVTTSNFPTPVITGNQKVCAGSVGEVYSTPSVSGHTYAWSLTGNGTITSATNTNSITVTWGSQSIDNKVTVDEGSPSLHTIANLTVDIGKQPTTTPTYSAPANVCYNTAPSVTINNSETNVRYQLRVSPGNTNSGAFVDGTGGTIVLTGASITSNTTYNIYGYTLAPFNCGVVLNPSTFTVNVNPNLTAGISGGTSPVCYNTSPGTFTATGGGGNGSYTYLWYKNGVSTGITTQTYNPGSLITSASFYCAITSGTCGTVNTSTTAIIVNPNLTASISGGTSPLCYNTAPGTFTATGSGGTGAYTYLWYRDGVSTGTTTQTYSPGNLTTSATFYCAVTSGSCGTVNTPSTVITVNGNLTASINIGNTTICYNTSPGTFTATSGGGTGSYTYLWYKDGASTGITTANYTPGNLTTSATFYCAVTSGACGTVNTSTTTITVYPNLTAGISGGTSPICYNTAPGTFTATGGGGNGSYTYLWYKDGVSTGITASSYTPGNLTTSATFYCAVTSGSCGTVNSSTTTITVYPNVTAGISGGSSPICYNNAPGTFTATGGGGNGSYTYLWYKDGVSTGITTSTYAPGNLTSSASFYCVITSGSCTGVNTPTTSITVTPLPVATFSYSGTPYCSNSANPSPTYSGGGVAGTFSSTAGLVFVSTSTGQINLSASTAGTYTVTNTIAAAGGCGVVTATSPVTITALPMASISYIGSPFCSNVGIKSVVFSGTAGGVYSSSPAGLSINGSSGDITTVTSTPGGPYTVSYTIAAAGGCSPVTATTQVSILLDGSWKGGGSDWNTGTNWDCGTVPTQTTDVTIANGKTPYPILSSSPVGKTKNLSIGSSATLTVSGGSNKLQIAGDITVNSAGPITASDGVIEMTGNSAQTIPANTFASNNLKDLIISNPSGVSLGGALNITGILTASSGDLASNGHLTLISTATQTALIDGSGSGQVTGIVNMQRYLASGFGYKYVSSPFSDVAVDQFSPYLSSTATIAKFYSYNENPVLDMTGWTSFTSGTLSPMAGYAANLGSVSTPKTITLSGTVNNGNNSSTLYNHNRTYTKGYNLVGNPYPSPIDWNATSGWTKTNLDGAIAFFNASGDQYSGSYSYYVNGVAGADGDNIIPAMQGFFVSVSVFAPSSGTLGMTNSVRINKPNPTFKSASVDLRTILRFDATMEGKNSIPDPLVVYFDQNATMNFDSKTDALKLLNTDVSIPNLYAITQDIRQLAISSMPSPVDSLTRIPLGVHTLKDGWVIFSAKDIAKLPSELNIYLNDNVLQVVQDLKKTPVYRFNLKAGEYNNRFELIFAKSAMDIIPEQPTLSDNLFAISRESGNVVVKINLPDHSPGKLYVSNMLGQILLEKEVTHLETVNISSGLKNGVYVVTLTAEGRKQSEKTLIRK